MRAAPAAGVHRPQRCPLRGGKRRNLSDIREWARKNGYKVSDRGRISSEVQAAYDKAHG